MGRSHCAAHCVRIGRYGGWITPDVTPGWTSEARRGCVLHQDHIITSAFIVENLEVLAANSRYRAVGQPAKRADNDVGVIVVNDSQAGATGKRASLRSPPR